MPWSVNFVLGNLAETVEYCFISWKDVFLYWDVLEGTLKKDIHIALYSIQFVPVRPRVLVAPSTLYFSRAS